MYRVREEASEEKGQQRVEVRAGSMINKRRRR